MQRKKIQIRETPSTITPVFADEAMVGISIKAVSRDGDVKKEGVVRLGFVDVLRGQMVAEIVLLPETARALYNALGATLKKLDEELKSKEIPKPAKKGEISTEYIG
ncbi:MAG: hypothetical protein DRO00_00225 [Thermoproteota archaeon]|nr:MAG: hypothetical protein DRN90_07220 [Candidatus Korarchaeota archaeon]RLG54846.1 MAG: hypothetical protein DRO00_00225 [Candidatus Korarchaeota archaeon]